jgi:protein-disulfide isomerase
MPHWALQEFDMKSVVKWVSAAATGLLLFAQAPAIAEMSPEQKKEIEALIRSYLLENPEILADMGNRLEIKQKLAEEKARSVALKENANILFRNPADASIGAAADEADVTVVEFIDYNCGWCKRSVVELSALLESDKKVRVVFKEFPIFGAGSEYAARAALASVKQGKYWEMHQALFAQETQVDAALVDEVAKSIGIDLAKLKADMEDESVRNAMIASAELGRALLINGTPAFVIDDKLVPGYMPGAQLVSTIQSVRDAGGCKLC